MKRHRLRAYLAWGLALMSVLASIGCQKEAQPDLAHSAEELSEYNRTGYFGAFQISGAVRNGESFYRLDHGVEPVSIFIDNKEEQATVVKEAREYQFELDFPLFSGGNATGGTSFYLLDLTDDGEGELICLGSHGGTGANETRCRVIELTQMKEYPVSLEVDLSGIAAIPSEIEKNGAAVLTLTDGTASFVVEGMLDPEKSWVGVPCQVVPLNWYCVNVEENGVYLIVGLGLEEALPPFQNLAMYKTALYYDSDFGRVIPRTDGSLVYPEE